MQKRVRTRSPMVAKRAPARQKDRAQARSYKSEKAYGIRSCTPRTPGRLHHAAFRPAVDAGELPQDRRLAGVGEDPRREARSGDQDRKSTRLNSSHPSISYAVFCLK